ncbi:MAG TPA: hypothetical protein PLW91_01230 [Candidatus Pacearchaeota archaeon]|nr:hypothetical protein [Candidatus Pacearchaeota archaeon]
MEKKEIAKFLSGFFTAMVLVDLGIVLISVYSSLNILGPVLSFELWTILFVSFLMLAIFFAFIGWGIVGGRQYTIFLLLAILGFSYYISADTLKAKNISLWRANLISMADNNLYATPINEGGLINSETNSKEFTFSLGSDKYDGGKAIVIDSEGNFYITGYFQGTVNLDVRGGLKEITSVGNSLISSATDIYLAKYSPERKLLWGFSIGSAGKDMPLELKLDNNNNVYLVGYFGGLADFNPNEKEEANLDAETGRDGFIAKYDSVGNFKWAKKIGNPEKIPFVENDLRFEEVRSLTIDSENNIYVTGVFDGTINLDEPNEITPQNSLTSNGNGKTRNMFVAKYDLDGKYLGALMAGGMIRDEAVAVQISPDNNLYLTGYFVGRSNFDFKVNKNKTASVFSDDDFDIFLAKYDKDLNFIWVKSWGGESNDYPVSLAISPNNELYLAGNFSGVLGMGNKKLISRGGSDIFFSKINKDGQVIFSKSFGGTKNDLASKIKIDSDDNLYITGLFRSVCDFDPQKTGQPLITVSDGLASDGFLAKYTKEGDYLWARDLGGSVSLESEVQSVDDVAISANNKPVVTGYFYDVLNFHSMNYLDLKSQGLTDIFVVEYNENGEIE